MAIDEGWTKPEIKDLMSHKKNLKRSTK